MHPINMTLQCGNCGPVSTVTANITLVRQYHPSGETRRGTYQASFICSHCSSQQVMYIATSQADMLRMYGARYVSQDEIEALLSDFSAQIDNIDAMWNSFQQP